ncbi:MAG: polysaccharide biosynthesis protein [Steroidobacteraceae bacterium]|nr:polysaccharide biosynthesis protein [Deltaproteobacteria bacterium]
MSFLSKNFSPKRLLVCAFDILLIGASFYGAFLLRFDFRIPADFKDLFKQGILAVLIIKPLIFMVSGLYRNLWRYASLQDGVEIAKVVTLSSFVSAFAILYFRHFAHYPRSIFVLDWILLISLVIASRLVWRIYRETFILPRSSSAPRTLIVGAGDSGNLLLKEIRRQLDPPYNVVGFIDDNHSKYRMRLQGVPVIGACKDLQKIIQARRIEDVIIAIPTAAGQAIRQIVKSCERCKIRFKILPPICEIIDGSITTSQIRDVNIEDLLGRDQVMLEVAEVRRYLTGKRVLVTGAAGSIGSEICRQVAGFSPAKLILLDSAETPLYQIEMDLTESFPDLRIIPILADIRQGARLDFVFETFMPEVVFHAAAFKHVPMMEYNPVEAVTNNIAGTRMLAEKARQFGVDNFVMISTDKAVNPTNIMGASKRAAEIFVQALAQNSLTKFTTVRFGNVLGSNGSVIPLFMEQIKKGGPLTVTHPEVVRYFMMIPEAAQLVLQAGCIGNGGEIFVLDMGEPVKILDLAEELIRLSGFVPYEEINIVFSGLRPGEKLFEELLVSGEDVRPTTHRKIKVLDPIHHEFDKVSHSLDTLLESASCCDLVGVMKQLKKLVPEFTPLYGNPEEYAHAFKRLRPDICP